MTTESVFRKTVAAVCQHGRARAGKSLDAIAASCSITFGRARQIERNGRGPLSSIADVLECYGAAIVIDGIDVYDGDAAADTLGSGTPMEIHEIVRVCNDRGLVLRVRSGYSHESPEDRRKREKELERLAAAARKKNRKDRADMKKREKELERLAAAARKKNRKEQAIAEERRSAERLEMLARAAEDRARARAELLAKAMEVVGEPYDLEGILDTWIRDSHAKSERNTHHLASSVGGQNTSTTRLLDGSRVASRTYARLVVSLGGRLRLAGVDHACDITLAQHLAELVNDWLSIYRVSERAMAGLAGMDHSTLRVIRAGHPRVSMRMVGKITGVIDKPVTITRGRRYERK